MYVFIRIYIQELMLLTVVYYPSYIYYCERSGGAGATLLVATFLILAEKSLMIVDGSRKEVPAMKDYTRINFGAKVGDKDVAHLNLLEAASW